MTFRDVITVTFAMVGRICPPLVGIGLRCLEIQVQLVDPVVTSLTSPNLHKLYGTLEYLWYKYDYHTKYQEGFPQLQEKTLFMNSFKSYQNYQRGNPYKKSVFIKLRKHPLISCMMVIVRYPCQIENAIKCAGMIFFI